MNRKAKGSNAERELIHMFWKAGFGVVRVAGSGSTSLPSPDIIAGNNLKKFAIECKATKTLKKYFTKKEINELEQFSTTFGAQAWVAVRFNILKWYFISIEDLTKTKNGYSISIEKAQRIGLLFEELINDSI